MRKIDKKYEQRIIVSDEMSGHHARFLHEANGYLKDGWEIVPGTTYGVPTPYGIKWSIVVEKEIILSAPQKENDE